MTSQEYQELVLKLRDLVHATLPPAAGVVMVSKGDDDLLKLGDRQGWHFPCTESGEYIGYNPRDSADAISHLESLRVKGGEYLVFPRTAFWWLEHYKEFRDHLERYYKIAYSGDTCLIYRCRHKSRVFRPLMFELGKYFRATQDEAKVSQPPQQPPAAAAAITHEAGSLIFLCNICSKTCVVRMDELNRDHSVCGHCGATMRMRAIINVLSRELFDQEINLLDFPARPDIVGMGMSDWDGYAIALAEKFNYQNTFYHTEPRLDITDIDPALEGKFDFIISSDVFEHIPPPVSVAFENVRKLLKPNGVFIFSVPYSKKDKTDEHFPDLYNYEITEIDGRRVLKNITRAGALQVFDDLTFHGGPGFTLEMRVFSEDDLVAEFKRAGLSKVKIYREPDFVHGIYFADNHSFPISARSV